jgi:RND family efflux transporter MFP subunit
MSEPRKKRGALIGLLQIAAIVGVVVVAVILSRSPSSENVQASAEDRGGPQFGSGGSQEVPPVLVSVVHPTPDQHRVAVAVTGSIVVRNEIELIPQVAGRVVSISDSMRAGGSFRAGESLLAIDRRDFELALAQASADVHGARSTLLLEHAGSDAAKSNYGLLNPGVEVPPLVARTPQIQQAKAMVASARARAEIAKLDLSRTVFSLPFAGRIVESRAEIGQFITKGQSFGTAFADDTIEAMLPISPANLVQIAPAIGRRARLTSGRDEVWGTVARLSPQLDDRTRFSKLYVVLDEPDRLTPGTFIDVEIQGSALANTFLIPEAAEGLNGKVWVMHNNRLEAVVTTIRGRTDLGVIVDAFDSKNGLVVSAVPGVREGLSVALAKPQNE